jgi:hypothetical protein
MLITIEIIPPAADFIFEGIAMSNYFHSGDYCWLAFTLVPILLPGIAMAGASIYYEEDWSVVLWYGTAFPISSIWQ